MTPAFPSEVPTPGRWIRPDRRFARGTRPRAREIGRPILSNPIRWRPARRPRTEARPRRTDVSREKKGIDKPRPVTEANLVRYAPPNSFPTAGRINQLPAAPSIEWARWDGALRPSETL